MNKDHFVLEVERVLGVSFRSTRSVAGVPALYAPTPSADQRDLLFALESHCLAWHSQGRTVLLGHQGHDPCHGIYVTDSMDPPTVMRAFRVGSHSSERDTAEHAVEGMRRIMKDAAFVPYFADAAGFKVKFEQPLSRTLAEKLEAQVLEFDIEALNLVEEGAELPSLAEAMLRTQRLELWWD